MINPAIQQVLPMLAANWWVMVLVAVIVWLMWMFMPHYAGRPSGDSKELK